MISQRGSQPVIKVKNQKPSGEDKHRVQNRIMKYTHAISLEICIYNKQIAQLSQFSLDLTICRLDFRSMIIAFAGV